MAITCFFNASYVNADINRYYLGPVLIAWTWLAILAAVAIELLASAAGEPPLADLDDETAGAGAEADLPDQEVDPGLGDPGSPCERDHDRHLTRPARSDRDRSPCPLCGRRPERPARRPDIGRPCARRMEPDSVIVSWWSYSTPLWYEQRVLGKRPDITIIDDRTRLDENLGGLTDAIDANLGTRPVYVLRLDQREVKQLAELYDLDYIDGTDATSLTKVIAKKGS